MTASTRSPHPPLQDLVLYVRNDIDDGVRYFDVLHKPGHILAHDIRQGDFMWLDVVTGERESYIGSLQSWATHVGQDVAVIPIPDHLIPAWCMPQVDEGQ